MKTKPYNWQSGDTQWWLVSKFYDGSGYSDPYLFLTAIRLVNATIYQVKNFWASLEPGDVVLIPSK